METNLEQLKGEIEELQSSKAYWAAASKQNSADTQDLYREAINLRLENQKLRDALDSIIRHQITVAGPFAEEGATVKIARKALNPC